MTLAAEIAGWDGKSRAYLIALHEAYADTSNYAHQLIKAAQTPQTADGATWLLKHLVETGTPLPDPLGVLTAGLTAADWPAQLHVLQTVPHLTLTPDCRQALGQLAARALDSPRPMLRAWAYSACDLLLDDTDDLARWARSRLAHGRASETASSIRARLKRCRA